MARFSSLMFAAAAVVVLVAMVAVAEASTKTIFTTTTVDDTNPMGRQMEGYCGQQIVDQEMLSHCSMYLTSFKGRSRGPGKMASPTEDHFQLCCMQLGNMDKECMCEGIKMMMNQLSPFMQQDMGQMMSMAQNLPKMCKYTNQPCQMKAVWF